MILAVVAAANTAHADPPKLTTLGKTAFALELPPKWTIDASTPDMFLLRSPALVSGDHQ